MIHPNMYRFASELDRRLYMAEIGRDLNESEQPGDRSDFVKHRRIVVPLLKDFRRSQQQKHQWRTNSNQLLKSIRSWHKKPEGKLFHRQLARFLTTRPDVNRRTFMGSLLHEERDPERLSIKEARQLKAALLDELTYYHSVNEQADLELILEELDSDLRSRMVGFSK